jgi:CheY-like chemotaxis protein
VQLFKNLILSLPTNSAVLVVEDDEQFRTVLCRHLRLHEYKVLECAGIENIREGNAIARTGEDAQPIIFSHFQIAFLDHYFQSATDNGTTLTPVLVGHGVTVIGMSSSRAANESMMRHGAVAAFQKRSLMAALR